MDKSSSNNDPCSRATQIIEAFPASQRITGILIPCENTQTSSSSTSTSPRCGLGPYFSSFLRISLQSFLTILTLLLFIKTGK